MARPAYEDVAPRLVEVALEGDKEAVRELVRALRPLIQGEVTAVLARSRGSARGRALAQEVDDFVQEVFANLFANNAKELRRWKPELGSLKTFIRSIAYCDAISILRSRTRSPYTEDPQAPEAFEPVPKSGPTPETQALSRDFLHHVVDIVRNELGPRGASVFELLVLREHTVAEVCKTLEMSEDAVYAWKSRISKLSQKVRDHLLSE